MRAARCDVIAGLVLSVMTAVMILGVAGCGAMGFEMSGVNPELFGELSAHKAS